MYIMTSNAGRREGTNSFSHTIPSIRHQIRLTLEIWTASSERTLQTTSQLPISDNFLNDNPRHAYMYHKKPTKEFLFDLKLKPYFYYL